MFKLTFEDFFYCIKYFFNKFIYFFKFSWAANTVIGPPRVYPQHGDLHGAWASSNIDAKQFIEVSPFLNITSTPISGLLYSPFSNIQLKYCTLIIDTN